ncbi:type-1 angiotensin II receptor-like [Biomphalaria glabrata]|uniref:Type-1 angiotensin II receptor-like n=1 Tax=Biomphalaria glabrata TaxID=6526 RepID=A0A9U8EIJ2_BIOGL|nr:type-1 angiotensin II receptor-like [Biomphalaria glabrata]
MNNFTEGFALMDTDFPSDPILDVVIGEWSTIVGGVFLGSVSLLGVIFNAVNVIVYAKMGQEDSVNIALLALSLSELGASIVLLLISCFGAPQLAASNVPVIYLISWFHVIFSRVASCLTAFITLERYLCVAMPLKVKLYITMKRTIVIVSVIYAGMTISMVPPFFSRKIESVLMPGTNWTVLTFFFRDENSQGMERISITVNNVTLLLAFAVVFISTLLLVVTLKRKSRWRSEASSASRSDVTSSRDQRVIKMITLIALIFIVSYLPVALTTAAMLGVPGYSMEGKYNKIFSITWGIDFFLEGTNATASIFVYLTMSSRYRSVLRKLLKWNTHISSTRLP